MIEVSMLSKLCRPTSCRWIGALASQSRFRHLHPVPFTFDPDVSLQEHQSNIPSIHDPVIDRYPGDIVNVRTVIRNWTSFPGVGFNSTLRMPVYQFEVRDAESIDDSREVILPNDIFGVPIRKDLIHRAYWFHRRAMAGYTMRIQLNPGEWPGSKKKLRSQKKSGKARMNWRKAPGKYLGVQIHPLRPHNQRKRINRKNVYQAMKAMLSAKYLDGSLMVVDDFKLSSHKTKYAVRALRRLVGYRCNSALLVHEGTTDVNDNFRFATAHISAVRRENASTVSVYTLLRYRKIIITEKGLEKLIQQIENYPEEQGWFGVNATPDRLPAPRPEKVLGWNAEWLQKKAEERDQKFTRFSLWERVREWKWTNNTKGAFKAPRHDAFRGFKLIDSRLEPYVPAWASTDQIVYHDEAPLDLRGEDMGDIEDVEDVISQLEQQETLSRITFLHDGEVRNTAKLGHILSGNGSSESLKDSFDEGHSINSWFSLEENLDEADLHDDNNEEEEEEDDDDGDESD